MGCSGSKGTAEAENKPEEQQAPEGEAQPAQQEAYQVHLNNVIDDINQ